MEQPASAVSRRAREITPFLVMDILERAKDLERRGEPVIHLEIGEPDFDTPQVVKEAAYRAMAAGETQYTHSQGLLELREALCQHYWEKYRVALQILGPLQDVHHQKGGDLPRPAGHGAGWLFHNASA